MVVATSIGGSIADARGSEAAALAAASLSTILLGGIGRATLEAMLLLSTGKIGEASKASGNDVSEDNTESS